MVSSSSRDFKYQFAMYIDLICMITKYINTFSH